MIPFLWVRKNRLVTMQRISQRCDSDSSGYRICTQFAAAKRCFARLRTGDWCMKAQSLHKHSVEQREAVQLLRVRHAHCSIYVASHVRGETKQLCPEF